MSQSGNLSNVWIRKAAILEWHLKFYVLVQHNFSCLKLQKSKRQEDFQGCSGFWDWAARFCFVLYAAAQCNKVNGHRNSFCGNFILTVTLHDFWRRIYCASDTTSFGFLLKSLCSVAAKRLLHEVLPSVCWQRKREV